MQDQGTTMRRRHSLMVSGASIAGALSNLVMMFITTRTLTDPQHQAEALAFWSLLVGLSAVVTGIQNETTRAVGSSQNLPVPGRNPVRMLPAVLVVAAVLSVLLLALSPWIVSRVLPSHPIASMTLLVISALFWSVHSVSMGSLAGRKRWTGFSALITAEVVGRALLMVVIALTGVSLLGYQFAMAAAVPLVVLGVVASPIRRVFAAATSDASFGLTVRRLLLAVLSTAAVAVLTTAYPALMKSAMTEVPNVAAWMLAVSLTRAPIMIPIYSFQQVAITRFVERPGEPFKALAVPLGLVGAAGVASAIGMAVLGPWFLTLFDPRFQFNALTLASLTLAGTMVAVLVLFSSAILAANRHSWYAGSWLLASITSVALLYFTDGLSPFLRLVVSLVGGPTVGGALIFVGLVQISRRAQAASRLNTDKTA